jgi:16S rRNA (uracil1498-N3)-methyltransferase
VRRFFISPEKITTDMPIITGSDAVHIAKVLRHKIGDIIMLFDGRGAEYKAKILNLAHDQIQLAIIQRFISDKEPFIHITVAQAFLKEKKMDSVVRQLSEIGATHWVPFQAKRSIPVLNAKRLAVRKSRWEKIAVEAAKQCGRNRVMSIEPAASLPQVLDRYIEFDQRIIFWEKETKSLNTLQPKEKIHPGYKIAILLGPEGGFDSREIKTALSKGFTSVGLGPRILRSETAAIAACSLIQFIFGDMGQQSA